MTWASAQFANILKTLCRATRHMHDPVKDTVLPLGTQASQRSVLAVYENAIMPRRGAKHSTTF